MSSFDSAIFSSARPNSYADVLLVTATMVETRAVLDVHQEQLTHPIGRAFMGGKTYFDLGTIGGARTFLVQSEMGATGPGAALLTVQKAIDALKPSAIIMVGIAFGVDPKKQRIGDVLVARQLVLYELQRVGQNASGQPVVRLRGDRPSASAWLLDACRSAALDWQRPLLGGHGQATAEGPSSPGKISAPEVRFGLMLSGEKLIDNQTMRDQLLEYEPEAIGGDMEGGGLYVVASDRKIDWIVVKAICDWADGHKARNKQQRQQLAARHATQFVFHVLSQGGFAQQRDAAPRALAAAENWPKQHGVELRQILTERLDFEELRTICFDLRIDFDNLRGEGKAAKVRELIRYLEQRDKLDLLGSWLRRHRRDIALE